MRSPAAMAGLVGVGALAFRYLTVTTLANDHFVILARAAQVLHGDLPVRDFEDPGQPLFYLLSAAAGWLSGSVLWGGVTVAILLLAVAAGCTYRLALRASGSIVAALAATVVAVGSSPRLNDAAKVAVPLVGIALAWRYVDRPGTRPLVALGAWTGIAFLFRHDYAVYLTIATIVLLAVQHVKAPAVAVRRTAVFGAAALAVASPWLAYVQWAVGVPEYFGSALRFVASESARTGAGWPEFGLTPAVWPESNLEAGIYYGVVLFALVGLYVAVRWRRTLVPSQLAFLSVLLLATSTVFLRDVLSVRLPNVTAVAAVLGAAACGQVCSARTLTVGAGLVSAAAALAMGAVLGSAGYGVPTPMGVVRHATRVTDRLMTASPEVRPDQQFEPIRAYLERCTPKDSRVLVGGFAPDIPVLARRAFAGGLHSWIPGYYEADADQTRAVERLARQAVSAAVVTAEPDTLMHAWPRVEQWLVTRGFREYRVPVSSGNVRVWLPPVPGGTTADPATGLPCSGSSEGPPVTESPLGR